MNKFEKNKDIKKVFLEKHPDAVEADFATETGILPLYSHELHGIHLRHHLLHIRLSRSSRSRACIPGRSVYYRLRIHRYRPNFPVPQNVFVVLEISGAGSQLSVAVASGPV